MTAIPPESPEKVQVRAPAAEARLLPLERPRTAAQTLDDSVVRMINRCTGSAPQNESRKEQEFNELVEVIKKFRDPAEWDDAAKVEPLWVDRFGAELASLGLILTNAVVIALETDFETLQQDSDTMVRHPAWVVLEVVLFLLFAAESGIMLHYHRMGWFRDGTHLHNIRWMNIIAAQIVLVLMVDVILDIAQAASRSPMPENGKLRLVSLLRFFEVAKLRERVKDADIVRELRMVIRGLGACYRVILWTILLIVLLVYILAVVATTQVASLHETYDTYYKLSGGWDVNEHFGSVARSMLTLLRMLTLDGWSSDIGRHVATHQLDMGLLFVAFIFVTMFGLLNFVLSLIVHQTLEFEKGNQAKLQARQERARRGELEQIKEIFEMADKDGSKELDALEFLEACKQSYVRELMYQLQLPIDDAAKLFEVVDGEGHRTLHQDEFIEGCMQLKGVAMSKDMLRLLSQADVLANRMDILHDTLSRTEDDMALLDDISWRIYHRFEPTIHASKLKLARAVAGGQPLVPVPRDKPGEDRSAPLAIGNRPALPHLPDLLK